MVLSPTYLSFRAQCAPLLPPVVMSYMNDPKLLASFDDFRKSREKELLCFDIFNIVGLLPKTRAEQIELHLVLVPIKLDYKAIRFQHFIS